MSSILAADQRQQQATPFSSSPQPGNAWIGFLLGICLMLLLTIVAGGVYYFTQQPSPVANQSSTREAPTIEAKTASPAAKPVVKLAKLVPQTPSYPRIEQRPQLPLQRVDLLSLRQQELGGATVNTSAPALAIPQATNTSTAAQESLAPSPSAEPSSSSSIDASEPGSIEALFAQAVAETAQSEAADLNSDFDLAPMLATMDGDFTRQVPPFSFQSHVYSSESQHRYVRINQDRLQEGDWVAPGVELVAIRVDDIVLRIDGQLVRHSALRDWQL